MNVKLEVVADVQAGHPLRSGVPFAEAGNAYALQMRDLSLGGDIAWDGLVRTEIDTRKPVQWLEPGDVIFVARGTRNYAVCLRNVPKPTVCSPHFFLVRTKSQELLPEFLAWQINRAPAQRYLAGSAEGSDQLSIRRPVLEALPLAIPLLSQQRLVVSLAEAAVHEERRLRALIYNRHKQLDALAFALISNNPELN